MTTSAALAKRTTKKKAIKPSTPETVIETAVVQSVNTLDSIKESFAELNNRIAKSQADFEQLIRQIEATKQAWEKEQKDHRLELEAAKRQEQEEREREKEVYLYELSRGRRRAEDEFADMKAGWEKQLREQQESLEKDKKELGELRKLIANFDTEKDKATTEAQAILEAKLTANFEAERKLKDQENKAEKGILNLKIESLTAENSKQASEILSLKKRLDEATKQLEEIALRVIESKGNVSKVSQQAE